MKENGSDISKIFVQKKWKAKNGAPEREEKWTSPAWQPAPAACWPASSARPFLHPKPQSQANHRDPQEAPTAAGNSAPEISQWINDLAEARRSDHSDLPAKAKSKRGRMWGRQKGKDRHGRRTPRQRWQNGRFIFRDPNFYLFDEWIHLWSSHKTCLRCLNLSRETGVKIVFDNDRWKALRSKGSCFATNNSNGGRCYLVWVKLEFRFKILVRPNRSWDIISDLLPVSSPFWWLDTVVEPA